MHASKKHCRLATVLHTGEQAVWWAPEFKMCNIRISHHSTSVLTVVSSTLYQLQQHAGTNYSISIAAANTAGLVLPALANIGPVWKPTNSLWSWYHLSSLQRPPMSLLQFLNPVSNSVFSVSVQWVFSYKLLMHDPISSIHTVDDKSFNWPGYLNKINDNRFTRQISND